jgi:peptidoglycan/LPS O-acetylase OafA/YrhL
MNELGLIHFGWFSLGILTFAFIKEKNVKWLYYAISMAIFSTLYSFISHEKSIKVLIALVAISVIFFLPIYSQKLKLFFENKFLSFVGFISYPLYLIHENFIISLTIKLHKIFPQIPALLLPILPLSLTVYIAYLITKYLEPYLTIKIKHYIF